MALTQDQFKEWVGALRSGEYEQAEGMLYDEGNNAYCCLGVLAEKVLHEDMGLWGHESGIVYGPESLKDALTEDQRADLASMNDRGRTFDEIATFIERTYIKDNDNGDQ